MRLKEIREQRGLRQRDIAELLTCSVPVYSRYETGERKIPLDFLEILADFYGVTIDDLIGRITEPAPPPEDDDLVRVVKGLDKEERMKVEAFIGWIKKK